MNAALKDFGRYMPQSVIAGWLEEIGLAQFARQFVEQQIEMQDLPELSEQDLEKLGIPLGPRKRLLKAIAGLTVVDDLRQSARPTRQDVAPVSVEGERRQLTVLFCDMVGFTELANRVDPEVLQKIIHSYEDACAVCITRFEGYVFQRLGDGIVAFFGYPLAHEGEAERAIRAGLEIIGSLSKLEVPEVGHLRVRVGIATGLVVVSSAEKGAVGETMNLASRLQGIAAVNTIVVSERVRRLAGGAFDYEDLGEQTLKGIAQPTHAYRILGVSEAATRFDAATGAQVTPLVGREQELGLLLERWALAQDGEGQVVLLSGEPGIGKSRILNTLRERLEAQGAQALRFQCSPYYVNSAFWPSIDNFERALKFGRDESPESKLDKLEALMVTHYGRPRADVRFVASILSIPCEKRYGALSMTPQKFKDETLRTLVDLTEAAARRQPSVMLFEDAHWADPTTLEVLDLLIDRVKGFPLLIVLTHRPEFQSRWSQHGHVAAVNLSKLTRAQSTAMVARITGGKSLPAELLEQVIAKTDGVPLFVEELTKSILESGELTELGDRFEYVGSARGITIPATLRDSLMARLDRFVPVKEIAQIGAAIGREFSYELISAVAPMSPAQLDNALTQLTDSGLAFRRGTPPDAVYTFKHALVQDAAYESLLKSCRQELHAKIARVLEERFPLTKETEPELLGHHLSAAGQAEAAIPLWHKAGELALRRMALREAILHLETALELLATQPASRQRDAIELPLRTTLSNAWTMLKGWAAPEVWDACYPALPLAKAQDDPADLLRVLEGIWVNVLSRGRAAESLRWVEEMLDAATGDPDLLIAAHVAAMGTNFWLGEFARSLAHRDQLLGLYDEQKHSHLAEILNHDPKTLAGHFGSFVLWILGYPDQAAQISDAKDEHARRRGHPFDLGFALTAGADVFDYRREPEQLRKRAAEGERVGRENGLPFVWANMAPQRQAMALIREGKAAEGIGPFQSGIAYWEGTGGRLDSPRLKSILAEAMALTGDVKGALGLIDEQIAQVERPGWEERFYYAEILRLKAWMLSLKGDLEGTEKNYLASLDWARKQQAKSWELRTSTSLARLWQSQGKRKEALDLLRPVYDWFTEGFDTKDLKEAKALLEELAA